MAAAFPEETLAELLALFAVEAEEHLETMHRHLLTLEQGPRGEPNERLVSELLREAHTLKGAARAVNRVEVETLSHGLEDLFDRMRGATERPGWDELQRVYATLDAIGGALRPNAGPATPEAVAGPGDPPEGTRPQTLVSQGDVSADPFALTPVSDETVRIRTDKLDALMGGVGELLVTRIGAEQRLTEVRAIEARLADGDSSRWELPRHTRPTARDDRAICPAEERGSALEAILRDLGEFRRKLEADARRMAQLTADLHEDVRRTRMLPLGTVFGVFPRMVRRLARDRGKEVALSVAGGEIEVDRAVLGQIKDPLMHLLRNCVDHGIESPEVRTGAGKPTAGTISVSACQRGDSLIVEVSDDGSGVDVEGVRTNAVKKGLLAPADAAELSDREAISLIFRSGFSTSPIITDLSGRGVGLDVVREAVERLHGSVDVGSRPRLGTTFSLTLPLSMSTMLCLLIEAGGGTFAVPTSSVERITRVRPEETRRAEGREAIRVDGSPVLLARLPDALGVGAPSDAQSARSGQPVVVLGLQGRRAAFRVDRLRGTHELVIKSLPAPFLRVRHVTGAAVVGAGEVALILSVADLMASLERSSRPMLASAGPLETEPATILVVEDSVTTRTLEKTILETAGFRVRVASDGAEAWNVLQSSGCALVLADVEMPRMDGFELTARIRADQRYRGLPVVLVTSRESREDRERGTRAGADAYIVKRGFDQDRLLETIRRLV